MNSTKHSSCTTVRGSYCTTPASSPLPEATSQKKVSNSRAMVCRVDRPGSHQSREARRHHVCGQLLCHSLTALQNDIEYRPPFLTPYLFIVTAAIKGTQQGDENADERCVSVAPPASPRWLYCAWPRVRPTVCREIHTFWTV